MYTKQDGVRLRAGAAYHIETGDPRPIRERVWTKSRSVARARDDTDTAADCVARQIDLDGPHFNHAA